MTDQSAKQEPVISIHGLEKSFGDNHVLQSFDLDLFPGENVVVLGKSGSGKSVLIKCIIGLMAPDAGSIKVFGKEVTELSRYDLDLMRVDVGFLFQSNALYDSMTVRENLEFPLRRHTMVTGKETVNDLVMEALTNVGLTETVDMLPEELSGGMRKRIALARALILKPKIILYDEPTTGLDPITGRGISQLMLDIQKKYNTSSIIISHDMNCAKTTANRIAMLIDGKCYALDTFENLSNSSDNRIKEFFDH
jgi:phospholipid/cholesterol/gamma-HCH transport system ATP-binding protein